MGGSHGDVKLRPRPGVVLCVVCDVDEAVGGTVDVGVLTGRRRAVDAADGTAADRRRRLMKPDYLGGAFECSATVLHQNRAGRAVLYVRPDSVVYTSGVRSRESKP